GRGVLMQYTTRRGRPRAAAAASLMSRARSTTTMSAASPSPPRDSGPPSARRSARALAKLVCATGRRRPLTPRARNPLASRSYATNAVVTRPRAANPRPSAANTVLEPRQKRLDVSNAMRSPRVAIGGGGAGGGGGEGGGPSGGGVGVFRGRSAGAR